MKANELRIGNFVYFNGILERIDLDSFHGIATYDCLDSYNPIPLTEEWLVNFGYQKYKNPNGAPSWVYVKNGDVWIYEKWENHEFFLMSRFFSKMVKRIWFVHQLQNLYFALTGEELEIK